MILIFLLFTLELFLPRTCADTVSSGFSELSNVKVRFSHPVAGSTVLKGNTYFKVFHPMQRLPGFLKSSQEPIGTETHAYLIRLHQNEGTSMDSLSSSTFNMRFESEGSFFIDVCVYDILKQSCINSTTSTMVFNVIPDAIQLPGLYHSLGQNLRYYTAAESIDTSSMLSYTDEISGYLQQNGIQQRNSSAIRVVHISDLRHIDGYKLHLIRQLTDIPKETVYQEVVDLTCDSESPNALDRPFLTMLKQNNIPVTEMCIKVPMDDRWKTINDWVKDLENMANADSADQVYPGVFVALEKLIKLLKTFHILVITNGAIEQDTYLAELARLIGMKGTILDLGSKGPKLLPYSFRGITAFVGQSSYVLNYPEVLKSNVRRFLLPPVVHEKSYSSSKAINQCQKYRNSVRTSMQYMKGMGNEIFVDGVKMIRVTYVGRISAQKGLGMFIYAIKHYVDHYLSIHPNNVMFDSNRMAVRFEIVGTGKVLQKAKTLVESLGLSNIVFFFGFIPNDEIPCLLLNSSIFVFPSLFPESFGMVNIEAMFMKLPIVAFGVGGTPDFLIHGFNGEIVVDRSAKGLAAAIDKLVLDADLRRKYGMNGFNLAKQKFSQELLIKRYVAMYNIICQENDCFGYDQTVYGT